MDCRIALAQIEPQLGNLPANLDQHLSYVDRAAASGAALVIFPELSLTGYFLKDQVADVARDLDSPEIARLVERSRGISIAFGFVELGRDGRAYNSVAFAEDGALLSVHRKVHLVTYGMFEESRDLAPGDGFRSIQSKHGRFGILICEDMWHVGSGLVHFLDGVDAILVHSSSPGRGVTEPAGLLRSARVWNTMLDAQALWFQTWIAYVNRVGIEDGIAFAGGSRVVDPQGREEARLECFEPGMLEARLTSAALRRARTATPLRRDEKPWMLSREILRAEASHWAGERS